MKTSGLARAGAILLGSLLAITGLAAPAQPAETGNAINTQSRNDVVNAYKARYLPAAAVKANWTGSVAGCKPGTQSADSLSKALFAVNFFRGLSGLDSVTLTPAQNAKAQAAALMMEAQRKLNHHPASTWPCFTELGKAGAGTSNLYLADPAITHVAQPVEGYMAEDPNGNLPVGHRRWLLNPTTTTMGIGTTTAANAINVFGGGTSQTRANPQFIAYPNAGYFPQQLEPNGLWSLSSDQGIDFSTAKVAVTGANGAPMAVKTFPAANGYGPNTVVFTVAGLKPALGGAESTYTVRAQGMLQDGQRLSHTYTVKLIDGSLAGASTPNPTQHSTPSPENPSIKSRGSVISIDSAGNLWNYGDLKTARVKIGSGWGGFSDIHVADWNKDGYFDIVGKTTAGQLYLYKGLRDGGFSRTMLGSEGWQNYTIDVGQWKAADRFPSLVAKHKTSGGLYHFANASGLTPTPGVQIGSGWQALEINLLDWNRDGKMDVVAKKSNGQMLLYRTNGSGTFLSEQRAVIGSGWQGFTSLTAARDFNGTGSRGLLARTSAGSLLYYQANTSAWAAPTTVGRSGWSPYVIADQ